MNKWWRMVMLLGVLGWGFARPALADPVGDLRTRLGALEQSVRELQAVQRDRGTVVADVATQAEQVRVDFQAVQGAVDGVAQQLQMYKDEVRRVTQDLDERLRTIEEQMSLGGKRPAMSSVGSSPVLGTSNATGPGPGEAESTIYQKALGQVHGGEYLSAAASFKQFVQGYPKSALVPNAQFWIGECYFAAKDYQRAIKEYQVVAERFARHEKANAALWKQGLAFEALGMQDEARLFLQKLVAKAPNSPEARKAAEKLKMLETQKGKYGPSATTTPAPAVAPAATPVTPVAKPVAPVDGSHQGIPLAPGVKEESLRIPPAVPASAPVDTSGGPR